MNNPTFALEHQELSSSKPTSAPELARSQGNGAILFTSAEELLADRNITGKILVDAFNEVSLKPVKKVRRQQDCCSSLHGCDCWPARRHWQHTGHAMGRPMSHLQANPTGRCTARNDTTRSSPADKSAPALSKEWLLSEIVVTTTDITPPMPAKARGAFAGKTIRVIELDNPRKEGTRAHKTYSLYVSGGSYEDLVANAAGWSTKGGVREDVAHDIKKGRIELI